MEVVVALAVVGLMCSLVLPLTASAMNSFNAAQKMREVASGASKKMANEGYGVSGSKKAQETLYVTIEYSSLKVKTESKLNFSSIKNNADNSGNKNSYDIQITYYDLEQKNVKGTTETKS